MRLPLFIILSAGSKIFSLVVLLAMTTSAHGQQIMQTLNDADKLTTNEQLFIGKPLKTLLKEIKPEIKMVSANPSGNNQTRLGYFILRFVDKGKYDSSSRANKKYPLQITVFVKEPFTWDITNRPAEKNFPGRKRMRKNMVISPLKE